MQFPHGFVHVARKDALDLQVQTPGQLVVYNWNLEQIFSCKTLEPQWSTNRDDQDSCMPNGWHWLVKRWSQQYGNHFHIQDVDYRTWMLMHIGNFRRDSVGCVLPGKEFIDIDGDNLKDVTSSGDTMDDLNALLPHRIPICFTSEFRLMT